MKETSLLISPSLIKLGLSPNETSVYSTLVEEGGLSAVEIANRTKLLPNAVYRLVNNLEKKGFIVTTGRYPKIFRALSPTIALQNLVSQRVIEVEKLKEKAVLDLTKKKGKEPATQISLIFSRFELMRTYAQMTTEAGKEILIVSIGETVPKEVTLANRRALDRGVEIRMVAHKFDQDNRELLLNWQKMGLKIRHFPDWGFHLIVFDGKKALLAVNNPKDTRERIGIQIFSEGLSKALRDYFYSVWEKAVKV